MTDSVDTAPFAISLTSERTSADALPITMASIAIREATETQCGFTLTNSLGESEEAMLTVTGGDDTAQSDVFDDSRSPPKLLLHTFSIFFNTLQAIDARHWSLFDCSKVTWAPPHPPMRGPDETSVPRPFDLLVDTMTSSVLRRLAPHRIQANWNAKTLRLESIDIDFNNAEGQQEIVVQARVNASLALQEKIHMTSTVVKALEAEFGAEKLAAAMKKFATDNGDKTMAERNIVAAMARLKVAQ